MGERWKWSPAAVNQVTNIWGHICSVDGTVSAPKLNKLVRSLPPPLGIGDLATCRDAANYMDHIGLVEVSPGRYTFEHTIFALIAAIAECPLPRTTLTVQAEHMLAEHFLKVISTSLLPDGAAVDVDEDNQSPCHHHGRS
jgi:hypothetical protein